jgi:hypothetical protein
MLQYAYLELQQAVRQMISFEIRDLEVWGSTSHPGSVLERPDYAPSQTSRITALP